jgi:hypothetical protein
VGFLLTAAQKTPPRADLSGDSVGVRRPGRIGAICIKVAGSYLRRQLHRLGRAASREARFGSRRHGDRLLLHAVRDHRVCFDHDFFSHP